MAAACKGRLPTCQASHAALALALPLRANRARGPWAAKASVQVSRLSHVTHRHPRWWPSTFALASEPQVSGAERCQGFLVPLASRHCRSPRSLGCRLDVVVSPGVAALEGASCHSCKGGSNSTRRALCKRLRNADCPPTSQATRSRSQPRPGAPRPSQAQPDQPQPQRAGAPSQPASQHNETAGPGAPGPPAPASPGATRPGQARAPQPQAHQAQRQGQHPSPGNPQAGQPDTRNSHRGQPARRGPWAPSPPQPDQPPPQQGGHHSQTHQAPQGGPPKSGPHQRQGPGQPRRPAQP